MSVHASGFGSNAPQTVILLTGRICRRNEHGIGRDHAGVVSLAAESKAGSGFIR